MAAPTPRRNQTHAESDDAGPSGLVHSHDATFAETTLTNGQINGANSPHSIVPTGQAGSTSVVSTRVVNPPSVSGQTPRTASVNTFEGRNSSLTLVSDGS